MNWLQRFFWRLAGRPYVIPPGTWQVDKTISLPRKGKLIGWPEE
jgi:hypothetical protein